MRKKLIIIGGIVFLLISIAVATFFVKQNQDNRQHASELSPTLTQTLTPTPEITLDTEEWNFLQILNSHRQSLGLSSLKVSKTLQEASAWMANDLATTGVLSHTDSLGRDPETRLQAFGYHGSHDAENVSFTEATGQSAFDSWLSACDADQNGTCTYAHKKNMEDPNVTAIGIGSAPVTTGSFQGNYAWVTDFGSTLDIEITPTATSSATQSPTATLTPFPTTTVTTTILPTDASPTLTQTPIPQISDSPTIQPTLTPTIAITSTDTPALTPTSTPTATLIPSATSAPATATPTIANPGGTLQTTGIVAGAIIIILGGLFLLAL